MNEEAELGDSKVPSHALTLCSAIVTKLHQQKDTEQNIPVANVTAQNKLTRTIILFLNDQFFGKLTLACLL